MTESSNGSQATDDFRAVLSPHRSLGPTGFIVLMFAIGAVSFVTGVVFLMMGAWPVFGFFGLDVLLVYLAFRLNYRSGRRYETIELTRDRLTLTRVHPSGRSESIAFNPYWVQVRLWQTASGRSDLRLASHGHEVPVGRFLTEDERADFAEALTAALAAARGGVRI